MLSFESTFYCPRRPRRRLVVFIYFIYSICLLVLRYSLFTVSDIRAITTSVEDYVPTDDLYLHSATSFSGAQHKRARRDVYVSPDEEEVEDPATSGWYSKLIVRIYLF